VCNCVVSWVLQVRLYNLVQLNIQLADGGDQYLPIYCAVCDDVNEDFVLTAHVVDQLQDNYNRKSVATECN